MQSRQPAQTLNLHLISLPLHHFGHVTRLDTAAAGPMPARAKPPGRMQRCPSAPGLARGIWPHKLVPIASSSSFIFSGSTNWTNQPICANGQPICANGQPAICADRDLSKNNRHGGGSYGCRRSRRSRHATRLRSEGAEDGRCDGRADGAVLLPPRHAGEQVLVQRQARVTGHGHLRRAGLPEGRRALELACEA